MDELMKSWGQISDQLQATGENCDTQVVSATPSAPSQTTDGFPRVYAA